MITFGLLGTLLGLVIWEATAPFRVQVYLSAGVNNP